MSQKLIELALKNANEAMIEFGKAISDVEKKASSAVSPSYHDLHITTDSMPRTSIFNLPLNLMVTCTRVGCWELWENRAKPQDDTLLAGEYDERGLLLDIDGHVICDSLTKEWV